MTKNKLDTNTVIAMDFLKSITGDDKVFEKELFELFMDNSKNNIEKLEKALANSDNETWYSAAHSLKGAASAIGSFDLSKELEYAQTHPKAEPKEKAKMLENIKFELARTSSFIAGNFLK